MTAILSRPCGGVRVGNVIHMCSSALFRSQRVGSYIVVYALIPIRLEYRLWRCVAARLWLVCCARAWTQSCLIDFDWMYVKSKHRSDAANTNNAGACSSDHSTLLTADHFFRLLSSFLPRKAPTIESQSMTLAWRGQSLLWNSILMTITCIFEGRISEVFSVHMILRERRSNLLYISICSHDINILTRSILIITSYSMHFDC